MSWQAFSWHEMMEQAKAKAVADRLQPAIDWTSAASMEFLDLVGAFLSPLALTQAVLGFWRLGADLGWFGDFFINAGLLSHWQVWLAFAIGTQSVSVTLNRWLLRTWRAQR